jgi:hydroxyethylthiazole kinase-like uncharacterized protein yjeF
VRGVWTVGQVRAAEQAVISRVGEAPLMRRAAFGVAVQCAELLRQHSGAVAGRRVALLAGAGNNGGDALWAGAFLRRRGVAVTAVLLAPERAHPAGLAALRRRGGRVMAAADPRAAAAVAGAHLVVDGIVGLSASGPLRPAAAALVAAIAAPVVAVDLPSGVEPDTGAVTGPAVTADATVTFGALKPVHVLAPQHCGVLRLVDIGIGGELPAPAAQVLQAADAGSVWPVPGPADDKYTQGVTGVAAGSATYPGAAVLTAGAAALATSGLVRYAGPVADQVRARWPELVATGSVADAGRVQAWVVGPGLGTGSDGRAALRHALSAGVPVCADADAITMLAADPTLWDARDPGVPVVLTPHDREFARLAGEAGADRVAAARDAAAKLGATVLLKGHATVVADPTGAVLVHPARTAWPATAGSGDVLSGLVGALLAAGLPPLTAAGAAVHVHELAAALAARGAPIPASALLAAVPQAIRTVRAAAGTEPAQPRPPKATRRQDAPGGVGWENRSR